MRFRPLLLGPVAILFALLAPCPTAIAKGQKAFEWVYVGTRGNNANETASVTEPESGQLHGIYAARLEQTTGELILVGQVAQLNRVRWVARDARRPVLYATHGSPGDADTAPSFIYSFVTDRNTGKLRLINAADAGGTDANHLVVGRGSGMVFSSNHGDASVSALPLHSDGSLGAATSVQVQTGSGPLKGRQDHAQAHGAALHPSGRYLLEADRGADRLFTYRVADRGPTLQPAGETILPPGSGPRHLAFDRKGRFAYVITDFSSRLHVYSFDARNGVLAERQSLPISPVEHTRTAIGGGAEVLISNDGHHLYASLRADQDCIVVYAIDPSDGTLSEMQRVASGGKSPIAMALDPTGYWMLVVNDRSNTVNVMAVNPKSGHLTPTTAAIVIAEPASVAF